MKNIIATLLTFAISSTFATSIINNSNDVIYLKDASAANYPIQIHPGDVANENLSNGGLVLKYRTWNLRI